MENEDSTLQKLYAKYGPGMIYGRDTIQSFIDDFNILDREKLLSEFPMVDRVVEEDRNEDIEEMKELDKIREQLKEYYHFSLIQKEVVFPKIEDIVTPQLKAPFYIMRDVFVPLIETTLKQTPQLIVNIIPKLSSFLHENDHSTNWDVPEISDKITKWLFQTSIFLKDSAASIDSIFSFWFDFIEHRSKAEDILIMSTVLPHIQVSAAILSRVSELYTKVNNNIPELSYKTFINLNEFTQIYCKLLKSGEATPHSIDEYPTRKCASHRGFLYVSDPTFGIAKVGTGLCGTIPGSLIMQNDQFRSNPIFMSICNELIFIRFSNMSSNTIKIIDINTLEIINEVQISEPLPEGPFTSYKNELYIISGNTLYTYIIDSTNNGKLKSKINVTIESKETVSSIFENKFIDLYSDEIMLHISVPNSNKTTLIYSISKETGETEYTAYSTFFSPFISFDLESETLISPNENGTFKIYKYSKFYDFYLIYKQLMKDISNVNFEKLLYLITFKMTLNIYSQNILNLNLEYNLNNLEPLLTLIKSIFSEENTQKEIENSKKFLEPSILMLYIYYQTREVKTSNLDFDTIINIIKSKDLNQTLKINLIISIINQPNNLYFDTIEKCELLLTELTTEEIYQIFSKGFCNYYIFITVLMTPKFIYIIEESVKDSLVNYPFLSTLLITINRGIFQEYIYSPSIILQLLPILQKCSKYVLSTLIPYIIYPLEIYLTSTIIDNSISQYIIPFVKEFLKYTTIKDLEIFANKHKKGRNPSNSTIVTIEETPHPYENGKEIVKHYNFPEARYITIDFDSQTETERNADYLQIFTDAKMENPLTDKMSGKFENWTSHIKTTSTHLTFKFVSDESINGYGYKAIITAFITQSAPFLSPNPFYDFGYFFFDILYKLTSKINEMGNIYKFNIPKNIINEKLLTKEEKENLLEQLLTIYTNEEDKEILQKLFDSNSVFPITFLIIKYLYENDLIKELSLNKLLMISNRPENIISYSNIEKIDFFKQISGFLLLHPLTHITEEKCSYRVFKKS